MSPEVEIIEGLNYCDVDANRLGNYRGFGCSSPYHNLIEPHPKEVFGHYKKRATAERLRNKTAITLLLN
jgi:hypothetical protein